MNLTLSHDEKRAYIEPEHPEISIYSQCDLLGFSRSSYYYKPQQKDKYNLMLMKLIDEQYTRVPFYGVPRMTAWLKREGHGESQKDTASYENDGALCHHPKEVSKNNFHILRRILFRIQGVPKGA